MTDRMTPQTEMFEDLAWQLHGREIAHEWAGWMKPYLKRVVYYMADVCRAPDEASAIKTFKAFFPQAQLVSCQCLGPASKVFGT